jgi:hypothetical protein
MTRSAETSRPSSSGSTPIQIVGTPPATVTRSDSSRVASPRGERSGPGMTSVAPTNTAAYGSPQAFAWNIGTTGSATSRSASPSTALVVTAIECR